MSFAGAKCCSRISGRCSGISRNPAPGHFHEAVKCPSSDHQFSVGHLGPCHTRGIFGTLATVRQCGFGAGKQTIDQAMENNKSVCSGEKTH